MYKIQINTEEESLFIRRNLVVFNMNTVDGLKDSSVDTSLNIKDEDGTVIAGILSQVVYNWLEVSILWVDEHHRRKKLGEMLLQETEKIARDNSCAYVKLDTLQFQALNFYLKCGYELYGKIDNPRPELTHYYLVKYLTTPSVSTNG